MSLLNRRRALLSAKGKVLPYAYQQVEYLESTGKQYIYANVFLHPTRETKYNALISFYHLNEKRQLMGADYGGYFGITANGFYEIGASNVSPVIASATSFDKVVLSQDIQSKKTTLSINGNSIYRNISQFGDGLITLFNITDLQFPCYCKLKMFEIYQDDVLVRNFIPCYRKADNEAGLYDLVNGEFYTNQGTGEFILGGEV